MKAPDLLELAVRNLRESVLRNSLTTVGVSVGVASLVAMLSLGVGLQQLANRRLERSGLFDTIFVTSRDLGALAARMRSRTTIENARVLDESARHEISGIPGVLEVVPDFRMTAQVSFDDKPHRAMIAAVPMSARNREAFENIQGGFFSSSHAAEALVHKSFAEELLGLESAPENPSGSPAPSPRVQPLIGKEVELAYAQRVPTADSPHANAGTSGPAPASRPRPDARQGLGRTNAGGLAAMLAGFSVLPQTRTLRIVGILAEDPDALSGPGRARVFIPLDFAQDLNVLLPSDLRDGGGLNGRVYSQVSVHVRASRDVPAVESAIRKMGLNAVSILDASRNLQRFFGILDLFLGIFGSLALAVASLGIINTLVMAILERRREIGILKALGASDSDVKKLFFVEAGAMGILGGMLGVTIGWMIGKVINAGTNIYLHQQNLPSETFWSVPWWLVLGALGFSLLVSLVSGLYPAARAAKLDPVQALRYE